MKPRSSNLAVAKTGKIRKYWAVSIDIYPGQKLQYLNDVAVGLIPAPPTLSSMESDFLSVVLLVDIVSKRRDFQETIHPLWASRRRTEH